MHPYLDITSTSYCIWLVRVGTICEEFAETEPPSFHQSYDHIVLLHGYVGHQQHCIIRSWLGLEDMRNNDGTNKFTTTKNSSSSRARSRQSFPDGYADGAHPWINVFSSHRIVS
jgi:hypothetical protein